MDDREGVAQLARGSRQGASRLDEVPSARFPWARLTARDAEAAWNCFLREHAALLLQVVRLFERDEEEAEECFLFVCEHLRRERLRRLRQFDARGAATFPTWLRAVTRNLCLDWRRHRFGRHRLPRSIARLPELEREIFRCIHLRGLTENEALYAVQAICPGLTRLRFAEALTRVEQNLDSRQIWRLLARRPRFETLDASGPEPGAVPREPADPRVDPEREAARSEERGRLISELRNLPPADRLLIRMRFERGLGLDEIARLTGRKNAFDAQRALQSALAALRERLGDEIGAGVSVKGD